MITMILQGGMGNEMFQYATGFAAARCLGVELQLDASLLTGRRQYQLNQWCVEEKVVTGSRPTRFESSMPYSREFVNGIKNGDVLQGYFQTEKYFSSALIALELKDKFLPRIRRPLLEDEILANENPVAIHVRRGDYLLPAHLRFHGILPLSYYASAVQHIQDNVYNPTFFIFSDDPQWAQDNLGKSGAVIVEPGPEAADIFAMSLCRHNIIANSSFSWWGAWLGSSDGIVIAPNRWFDEAKEDPRDIVPGRWIKI